MGLTISYVISAKTKALVGALALETLLRVGWVLVHRFDEFWVQKCTNHCGFHPRPLMLYLASCASG